MKVEDMKKMGKEELVEKLNQEFGENPEAILDQNIDQEQFDSLCAECYGETEGQGIGDECWTVCTSCQLTEGKTCQMTLIESLDVAYNWDTKKWIVSNGEVGQTY